MTAINWETLVPQWLPEALPLGIFVADTELIVRCWCHWMEQHSGLPATAVIGQSLLQTFPELAQRGVERQFQRALGGETILLGEPDYQYLLPFEPYPPHQELRYMCQQACLSPLVVEGKVVGVLASISDSTEPTLRRQQLEATVSRQEETIALLDTLISQAPVGFAFLDTKLRYHGINERLAAMHGPSVAEHVGRTIWEVVPELAAQQAPHFAQVLSTAKPVTEVELVGATPAQPGVSRIWRASYYPVRATDQRIVGVGTLLNEITEQRRAEQEALRARSLAEEALRMRDTFFSLAAHELRTPLTTLLGRAQLLQKWLGRSEGVEERSQRAIDIVVEQAQRLNQMISALLDVSRIQSGRFSIAPTRLTLNALVRRVIEEWQLASGAHQISFEEPDGPLEVRGDEVRLEQVLQSVFNNALKYSPGGSDIRVTLARDGDEVCLAVHDEGIGIPEAAQGKLFRRFFRAENAEQLGISGLGIGLFVANEIMELHGGRIDVESVEGYGSTFTIRLPLV